MLYIIQLGRAFIYFIHINKEHQTSYVQRFKFYAESFKA